MREPWRVDLLGGVAASRGGRLHERFRTRKTAALLGWLALHAGRRLGRDALVELLWPGRAPEAGRNGLSKALSSLRAQLEPPGVEPGSVLEADRDAVRLRAGAVETDVARFDSALSRARDAAAREGAAAERERRAALEEALALAKGPLLHGLDLEEARPHRERLQAAAVGAAIALAESLADHDPARAIEAARRATALDPLHEGAHRALLRLLGEGGEAAAAARAYEALARRMEEEVGARPSRATEAAARGAGATPAHPERSAAEGHAKSKGGDDGAGFRLLALPLELSRFVGREEEIARVAAAIAEGARLLTITGPGGIGKTRLSLEVARRLAPEMPGGVRLVALADLGHARLFPRALLATLGLEPRPGEDALAQAAAAVAGAPSLLVLDNAEHLAARPPSEGADASSEPALADLVRALLERAPSLACLVTSRRTLGLSGEREEPLAPLEVPPEGEARPPALLALPSVRLFVERARRARPRFALDEGDAAAVGALVRRLEGIPLAIALAAGRSHALAPAEVLARIDEAGLLDLPAARERDTTPRHRTLRAALDASWALLSPPQRALLARLSVFRGGFSLGAVEEVCGEPLALDLLCDLRECSLLSSEARLGATRFRALEVVREHAAERLAEEERARVEGRHLAWALSLAERHGERARAGDAAAVRALEEEHENLRAALDRAAREGASLAQGARLAAALAPFWDARGHWAEAERRIAGLLALLERAPPLAAERAALLRRQGDLARRRGDLAAARASLEACASLERALGESAALGAALGALGAVRLAGGDREAAAALLEESCALLERLDPARAGGPRLQLGLLAHAAGDLALARARFSEAAAAFEAQGDRASAAFASVNAAVAAAESGALEEAGRRIGLALEALRALGSEPGIAGAQLRYGAALRAAGRPAEARAPLEDALARAERLGARQEAAYARVYLGALGHLPPSEGRALVERGRDELRALGQARGVALAEGVLLSMSA